MLMSVKIGMVSLGCSKNLVDSERMLYKIRKRGYKLVNDAGLADIVVVNTCGFIQSAKEEAIETILEFCQLKSEGNIKKIIVTGCLAERYKEETAELFPEADAVIGIGCNEDIIDVIDNVLADKRVIRFDEKEKLMLTGERIISTLPFFAYLKIAEGCSNSCSYCAIPSIRGRYRSVPMEEVLKEAKWLAENGVTEMNVIAQDSTRYGIDLYKEFKLPKLLREICKIDGIKWVRVLYCYPERVTDELLEVIASEDKIVKYMDIPIQHCDKDILRLMNRSGSEEELRALFAKIRAKIPNITLRTTLITGFPKESGEQYVALAEFVKDMEFDRLGCFPYSEEEGTVAAGMDGQIDEETRQKRAEIIMDMQNIIAEKKNAQKLGKVVEAVVEGYDKFGECYFGRTAADAPDIDGKVFFTSDKKLNVGEYVNIEITETLDYDLIGVVADEFTE
ncbi:MAG TPA: 30S ribosomal protein S12 methylthiotransferase RimO [Clostridiales bacterium]|nr:30S ribosomal protein S12 methylthiotransferase RimO [Clostridiales bacterium]